MKINVLYIITTLQPYGGAEVALANLVPYINKEKYNVFVGTVFDKEDKEVDIQLPEGHVVHFNFSPRYYLDFSGYKNLVNFIKKNQISVVHTHLFSANLVGRIAAFLAKVPVIISTEHNTYVNRSKLLHIIDAGLSRITTKIVAVSFSVMNYAAEKGSIDKSKFLYIPNCVPVDKIPLMNEGQIKSKLQELDIDSGRPLVLSVGRLIEQKNYPCLLDAVKKVAQNNPGVLFLIAGKGELKEILEQKIKDLGIENNVRLLGFRSDVYQLMQISSILAMPSLWEGLPVTLIEAGACGLPVVATAVGGIKEVVQDGKNGIIVPIGDSDRLAVAIESLISNPEALCAMSQQAKEYVENHFSGFAVASQIEKLYEECLKLHS